MRYALAVVALLVCTTSVVGGLPEDDSIITRRGDSNHDGVVNGSDLSHLSAWLYQGGAAPPCLNQADVNDDGSIGIADVSYLSNWLYQGGPVPPAPGPYAFTCTTNTYELGCANPQCE